MKQNVFNNYERLLENELKENKITLQKIPSNCERANWMFAIKLNNNKLTIDELNNYFTNINNIEIRPFFYPFNSHKHLVNLKSHSNNDISVKLNSNIIMLPSYPELTLDEQEYICVIIKKLL